MNAPVRNELAGFGPHPFQHRSQAGPPGPDFLAEELRQLGIAKHGEVRPPHRGIEICRGYWLDINLRQVEPRRFSLLENSFGPFEAA